MFADCPQVRPLSGGRLHLSHGPIDVVLRAWGKPVAVAAAYRAATVRFPDILPELCRELPQLRAPIREIAPPVIDLRSASSPLWGGSRGIPVSGSSAVCSAL